MKKSIFFTLIFFVLFGSKAWAQLGEIAISKREIPELNGRIIGLNTNPMLNLVVPFSVFPVNRPAPIVSVRRLWGGNGYRSSLGFTQTANEDQFRFNQEEITAYFSTGYTHKAKLYKNFFWQSGIDLKLNIDESRRTSTGFFGLSSYFGVEYHINEVFSVSSEASIDFGVGDLFVEFRTNPPINIFAHFNLSNKKK